VKLVAYPHHLASHFLAGASASPSSILINVAILVLGLVSTPLRITIIVPAKQKGKSPTVRES
jgi:hypothetical protein